MPYESSLLKHQFPGISEFETHSSSKVSIYHHTGGTRGALCLPQVHLGSQQAAEA